MSPQSTSNRIFCDMPSSLNPTSAYRWQDAAGLEHACWQCPTKSNSPRALQTCYGAHSMPCTAYHPTMHAIGAAHRCTGCVTGREMHLARHRQIAELVTEFQACNDLATVTTPSKTTNTPRTPLFERNLNLMTACTAQQGQETDRISKSCNVDEEQDIGEEDFDVSLSACSSTSTTASVPETPKRTAAERRIEKKARKDFKSQQKALKNQDRHVTGIAAADIEFVATVLHGQQADAMSDGAAHPLQSDPDIETVIRRNLAFVKHIEAHKSALFKSVAIGRKESKERKRLKKRAEEGEMSEEAVEMDQVVSAAMIQLGIPESVAEATRAAVTKTEHSAMRSDIIHPGSVTRKRKGSIPPIHAASPAPGACKNSMAIAQKLRASIKEDLEKHDNEIHERYVRAGGFWRYANNTVFHRMMSIAQELDVSTGEFWDSKRG